MAASDARPVPRKNAAWRVYFAIRKSDGTLITSWTGADSEVSKDGSSFADCTDEATEVGTSGCGYLDLSASEMNADAVTIKITVTNTGALPLVLTVFPEEAGDYRADVTHFGGTAGTFSSGRPEVNTTHWGGTAVGSVTINCNMTQISGDTTAADNAESFFDGTGYAGTNNVIPTVSTVTNGVTVSDKTGFSLASGGLTAVTSWTVAITGDITGNLSGSVGSVTAGVTVDTNNDKTGYSLSQSFPTHFASMQIAANGHVSAVVESMANNSITASAIQGDAITAAKIAADAVAEIQSGLATATELAKVPKQGETRRYTQVAADSGNKTADVSIGAAL